MSANDLNSALQTFYFFPRLHILHIHKFFFSILLHESLHIPSFHLPLLKNCFITSPSFWWCCRVTISKHAPCMLTFLLLQGESVGLPFIPHTSVGPIVSNGNTAFPGRNLHCAVWTCLLCPSFIPFRDSTQSYHIKHRGGKKREAWKEKSQFSQLKGEQQVQQASVLKDESECTCATALRCSGSQTKSCCFAYTPAPQLRHILIPIHLPTEPSSKKKTHRRPTRH